MPWLLVAEGSTEPFIKTVDYVSNQGSVWLLTAALIICGTVVVFLMRRVLKDGAEVKSELKVLNEKHIAILEKTAIALAENAADVRSFGRQVTIALDQSTAVLKGNTDAMRDNADATRNSAKANEAASEALIELKLSTDRSDAEARLIAESIASAIRRNTEALEETAARNKAGGRKPPT